MTNMMTTSARVLTTQLQAHYQRIAYQQAGIGNVNQRKLDSSDTRTMLDVARKLPCSSRWKEIIWRMAAFGVPGAGAHGIPGLGSMCHCGYQFTADQGETLSHMFWHCPVSKAVLYTLQQQVHTNVEIRNDTVPM